ncbi:hypothetical protein EAS64_02430 [Trebonia kvetii]|uniref:tRNA-guanine(15) transglycosylase-like domain-containing protein n=1 Tax=Trebonia kvetii TaxID=2480626 RepID=A0A6P2C4Y5_9ACTN|nr:hypothetical protein [Trebonia kvetii]TVZ06308.1 hypothetical protein EAS64_02430 [Trebonia kvetii]
MSEILALAGPMGFVASEKSLCSELDVAAAHCAAAGLTLAVSSADAIAQCALLRAARPGLALVADTRHWARHYANGGEPSQVSGQLIDLDTWAELALAASGAAAVLAPAGFIRLGDTAALGAVLAELGQSSHPGLVGLVATDADTLTPKHLPGFTEALRRGPRRPLAFLFAHKSKPLARYPRLRGLRELLSHFPGSHIHGVDALAGTDAIAHGAGWVGIGASSSRRWPQRPADNEGGPLAAGYLPGTFLRELLEMRSPLVYADWYANSPSPACGKCPRRLESYRPVPADKALIIAHNMHGIDDFARELAAQPSAGRAAWLNGERVAALLRHTQLTAAAGLVAADLTLRYLCELDDPQMRETTPAGGWR